MRKVKFKGSPNGEFREGLFHQWGYDALELSEGCGIIRTVGIIEDEKGEVHQVNPDWVVFTDK